MKFDAVILDMDGLMVDTEPFWKTAEIEVFRALGVPLSEEMCRETTGFRMSQAVDHWFRRYPWKGTSLDEVASKVVEKVGERVRGELVPKPGLLDLMREIRAARMPISVCSSSPLSLIRAVVGSLGLGTDFQVLQSAEEVRFGKPHPEAYLKTAEMMGADPLRCAVFEDSITGVISAKAARMTVIGIPSSSDWGRPEFSICDQVYPSLSAFMSEGWTACFASSGVETEVRS